MKNKRTQRKRKSTGGFGSRVSAICLAVAGFGLITTSAYVAVRLVGVQLNTPADAAPIVAFVTGYVLLLRAIVYVWTDAIKEQWRTDE